MNDNAERERFREFVKRHPRVLGDYLYGFRVGDMLVSALADLDEMQTCHAGEAEKVNRLLERDAELDRIVLEVREMNSGRSDWFGWHACDEIRKRIGVKRT
jgi:hypothetical protein